MPVERAIIPTAPIFITCSRETIPVFSGKKYLQQLNCCLNQIIAELTPAFPEIKVVNFLDTKNIQYLYESMAYSIWKIRERHTNFLAINVNIGDAITDMSAILIDEKGKKMCAYSSVEYAGSMLLKAAVRDMLSHTQCEKKAEAFLLHLFCIHESYWKKYCFFKRMERYKISMDWN